jgi:hypothetical protein
MIAVTFRCGHRQTVPLSQTGTICCAVCGTGQVARVKAPPPTFTGHVLGPRARTKDLGPAVVDLTTEGPLKLKPHEDEHG